MDVRNITWIISLIGGMVLLIYTVYKYRLYKSMENTPLKRLTGEVVIMQVWIIIILILVAMDKVDFIIAFIDQGSDSPAQYERATIL